jgi:hypothetical protein
MSQALSRSQSPTQLPDFTRVTAELVRALRGRRSQVALSRKLRFATNVVYGWEKRRRHASLQQLLELGQAVKADWSAAFLRFYPTKAPTWLTRETEWSSLQTVSRFLTDIRGAIPLVHLAQQTGFSRYAIARWLAGAAVPRAWEFLSLLHHCTHRLLDFLEPLTGGKPLASLKFEYERVHAARLVGERYPLSQVLLRCLELESNRTASGHSYASRIGISTDTEREILSLLEATGQVEQRGDGWAVLRASPLNMRLHRETAHLHREFWVDVARQRAPHAADALCAYNVCGVSREGFDQLKRLQREYLQKARAIIETSEPVQRVALLQVNFVSLVDDPLP